MVLFLNYLPYIILVLGFLIGRKQYKKYRGTEKAGSWVMGIAFATIITVLLLSALTAGYIPKASVERIPPPDFSAVEGDNAPKIENRLHKPDKTKEQAQQDFDKMVDWRAAKAARENPQNTETTELPLPPQN